MSETTRDRDDSVRARFPLHNGKALTCSPSLLAVQYARYLRKGAADFRNFPPKHLSTDEQKMIELELIIQRCGNWIIEAFKFGLFPELPELRRLVEFHTSSMPDNTPTRDSDRPRCPQQLFCDLCGMSQLILVQGGEGEICVECNSDGSFRYGGGLISRLSPGYRHLPQLELFPATCDVLADLVDVTEKERSALASRSGDKGEREEAERGKPESNRPKGSQQNEKTAANRPPSDPNQPSQDRQDDILAAINDEGMPLTRPELVRAMRLKTDGKLGHHLAWMVKNNKLVKIPQRGYWLTDRPVPK